MRRSVLVLFGRLYRHDRSRYGCGPLASRSSQPLGDDVAALLGLLLGCGLLGCLLRGSRLLCRCGLLLGCLLAHARLYRHPMLSGSRLLGRRHPNAHLPGVGLNLHPWHDLLLQGLLRLLGCLLGRCHLLGGVLGSDGILLGDGCLLGALLGSRLRDRRLSGTCLSGRLRLLGGLLGRCHLLSGVLGSDGILLGDGCLLGTLLGSRLRHGTLLGSRLRDRRLSGTCLSGRLRLLRCRLCGRGLLGACLGSSRLCWLLPRCGLRRVRSARLGWLRL